MASNHEKLARYVGEYNTDKLQSAIMEPDEPNIELNQFATFIDFNRNHKHITLADGPDYDLPGIATDVRLWIPQSRTTHESEMIQ